ncbi:hypothetical protein BN903_284 [Halorubrum sp. AJ67]|nr:hypothetical protein BN903_284 [Halorubrum sp. AJ67]
MKSESSSSAVSRTTLPGWTVFTEVENPFAMELLWGTPAASARRATESVNASESSATSLSSTTPWSIARTTSSSSTYSAWTLASYSAATAMA